MNASFVSWEFVSHRQHRMNRRTFLGLTGAAVMLPWQPVFAQSTTPQRFRLMVAKAQEEGWADLPVGDLMAAFAEQFVGTRYVGGTLEQPGPEQCRIDLTGLDCVTFVENILAMARMMKLGGASLEEMEEEVTYTRYRGGILDGYASRLHYTAEWIADNVSKGVVRDITPELGGEPLTIDVHFMSEHASAYPALKTDPSLVPAIAAIERSIRRIPRTYIPTGRIAEIEGRLRTGDIVAIATSKKGLDYAHMGMVLRNEDGCVLVHASSSQKKVVVDGRVSEVIAALRSHTGISVMRPLEP